MEHVGSHWKRPVYLWAATVLGILLSTLAHALVEIVYLGWAGDHGITITWTKFFGIGSCALPLFVQYGLFLVGLVGGWLMGRVWWQIVYVEHRHWWPGKVKK